MYSDDERQISAEEYARRVRDEVRHTRVASSDDATEGDAAAQGAASAADYDFGEPSPAWEPEPEDDPRREEESHRELSYEELDREAEELERRAREEGASDEEEVRLSRQLKTLRQFLSGTILVRKDVSKYYPYMLSMAAMFLVSIVVIFWSLHLDIRYSRLESEVKRIRERSIRLEELRFRRTTHSAVLGRLRERGIDLYEPLAPSEKIED